MISQKNLVFKIHLVQICYHTVFIHSLYISRQIFLYMFYIIYDLIR